MDLLFAQTGGTIGLTTEDQASMSFGAAAGTSRCMLHGHEPIKGTYDHLDCMKWLAMRGQKWSFPNDEMENVNVQVVVEMCTSSSNQDSNL